MITLTIGADTLEFDLFWFWALPLDFDLVELDELLEDFFDLLLLSPPAMADDDFLLNSLVKHWDK